MADVRGHELYYLEGLNGRVVYPVTMEEYGPLVHVIVVNYNGKSHLEYCLPSLLETEYENLEIVVVDNDSSDGSVAYVEKNFPTIKVIEVPENVGWGRGNNIGIEHAERAGAKYVAFANNDIRVHPAWIQAAVDAAEDLPEVGFVGFDVLGARRPEPLDKFEAACDEWSDIDYKKTEEFIDGMALFARVELFEGVGPIDEDFFAYAEETDLEIRAEMAGYQRARTNVPIWHYSSGSWEEYPLKASYLAIRNNLRLAFKHEGVAGILRAIARAYHVGCNPFFGGDRESTIIRRRRPRGIVFNLFLVTYCLLWNVVHLPQTMRARRREHARIKSARSS